jgi:hypothetical protein
MCKAKTSSHNSEFMLTSPLAPPGITVVYPITQYVIQQGLRGVYAKALKSMKGSLRIRCRCT